MNNIIKFQKYFLFLILLISAYFVYGLLISFNDRPVYYNDSNEYLRLSKLNLYTVEFWLYGIRPATLPLLMRIFDNSKHLIYFFSITYFASWSLLAFICYHIFKNKLIGIICGFALLLLSLSDSFLNWNTIVLTESLSISGLIFIVACLLYYLHNITEKRIFSGIIHIIFPFWIAWLNLRDNHILITLALCCFLCIHHLLVYYNFKILHRAFLFYLMLILIATFVQKNASITSGRALRPLANSYALRIFQSPHRIEQLNRLGMPITNEIMEHKESRGLNLVKLAETKYVYMNNSEQRVSQSMFANWFINNGERAYIAWIVLNLPELLKELFKDWDVILVNKRTYAEESYSIQSLLPVISTKLSMKLLLPYLFIMLILILIYCILSASIQHWTYMLSYMLFASVPICLICYICDAGEIERHCLQIRLYFYLSFTLMFFYFCEVLSLNMKKQ